MQNKTVNNNTQLCVRARIMSCLETILELESKLSTLPQADVLLKEFIKLKKTTRVLEQVEVKEEDAERIEKATSQLLQELEIPLTLDTLQPDTHTYQQ